MFRFNWVVTLVATATLWSFTCGVLLREDDAATFFANATSFISNNFTWLYTFTQNAWLGVILYVLLRKKYASIKLGQPDDKPDFSDAVWFILIFTTGLGTGIFYFGVSEPMYYYRSDAGLTDDKTNYLAKIPFMNDDQRATMAMFMTFFHWGLHGWSVYILIALTLSVVTYRLGRPMTIRQAFYPLFGDYVNGLFGDLIDALSIACTTFGLCTSLGLGAASINATLHRMNKDIAIDSIEIQSVIIWGITALTTMAVISGINRGMVYLALTAFMILSCLVLLLFMQDNTFYLINSFVQYVGTYIQYFILAGFDNDALPVQSYEYASGVNPLWGATGLKSKIETALNDTFADPVEYYESSPNSFMDSWTVFYWAWWITWAPFVGMFIAKISRGRTIRSVILVGMFAPMFLGFFAINVLGSLGIKMQRTAELALKHAPDWRKGVVNCGGLGYLNNEPSSDEAKALADVGYYALSCRKSTDRILDVLEPYKELKTFLQVLVLLGVIVFFVTSSDAGAFVDDIIAANGHANPPVLQKVWWSITQGAVAQSLLSASKTGLATIQSVSICAALPYTFALNSMCVALFRACDEAIDDPIHMAQRKGFSTSIVDVFENFAGPDGSTESKLMSTRERLRLLVKCIFKPYDVILIAALELFTPRVLTVVSVCASGCYYLWFMCLCISPVSAALTPLAWLFYIIFVVAITSVRYNLRKKWNVIGNPMDDLIVCFFFFPFALAQMQLEVQGHTGRA